MSKSYQVPIKERLVNLVVKNFFRLICKTDDAQLPRVPQAGPLIITTNHVNFIEGPILYTHLQPRDLSGFAKIETWDSRPMGWLFDVWGAIPIRRGEADISAIKDGVAALKTGQTLAIAPEGTRSNHGRLQKGYPGIVMLALRSGSPLIPIACYGHETYRSDLKRLRRTQMNIRVGRVFRLHPGEQRVNGAVRQQMTDEIMYQIAALLPPEYRGEYSDLSKTTTHYLRFENNQ